MSAVVGLHRDDVHRYVEDGVSYAVGHQIRVELLAALHEGPASTPALAKTLGGKRSALVHHVNELLKSGSIEVAYREKVGNIKQVVYCVAKLSFYSDEEWRQLKPEERQVTSALILQAALAEALASLWAGKFHNDPQVMVAWNRLMLDQRGRDDLADEQGDSWRRIRDIEARPANRRAIRMCQLIDEWA